MPYTYKVKCAPVMYNMWICIHALDVFLLFFFINRFFKRPVVLDQNQYDINIVDHRN